MKVGLLCLPELTKGEQIRPGDDFTSQHIAWLMLHDMLEPPPKPSPAGTITVGKQDLHCPGDRRDGPFRTWSWWK